MARASLVNSISAYLGCGVWVWCILCGVRCMCAVCGSECRPYDITLHLWFQLQFRPLKAADLLPSLSPLGLPIGSVLKEFDVGHFLQPCLLHC